MSYKIARLLIRLIFRLLTRVEFVGLEHLPLADSYIVVSNHIGRLDAGLVYMMLERRDIIMLVAEKYQKSSLWRWLVRALDGIWVDRFNADLKAVREALRRMKEGGVLVLAPEGTRGPNGALQEGWDGASYIAGKSGALILPVGVTGTQDALLKQSLLRLRRMPVKVYIGPPFTLPPLTGNDREAQLHRYTDEIMCQIAAVLPESYRGVYADHPRTRELLAARSGQEVQP